jgi:uncharacterized protein YecT (DUF1311 family)
MFQSSCAPMGVVRVLLAALALAVAAPVLAEENPCEKAEAQVELNRCWSEAAAQAVSDLAQRQSTLNKIKVSATQKELLKKDLAAWNAYAQAHCAAATLQASGGSSAPMVSAICRYRLAKRRASDVDAMAEDLSR